MPDAVPVIPLLPAFLSVVIGYGQELLVSRELGERTCKNMRQTAVQCLLFLQQKLRVKQLERVEPQHLEAFFRHLEACRYAVVTRQRKLKEVKMFFAWLKQAGHILHEPAAGIVLPPARPPAMQYFSVEEIEQMLTTVDIARDKALLYLLLHTGITLSRVLCINAPKYTLRNSILG